MPNAFFYEVCLEDEAGESALIGTPRLSRKKADAELRILRRRYPTAYVASIWYCRHADGSTWRRPCVRFRTPVEAPRVPRLRSV